MININIAYPLQSDLILKVNKYPDGQQDVVIDVEKISDNLLKHISNSEVIIKTRLNNFKDIELLLSATSCLKRLNFENIHVYCPYIVGGRSDRKFVKGGSNYIKEVLSPVINLKNYKSFTCIDPHSDVLEASINNLEKITNSKFVKEVLDYIYGTNANYNLKFLFASPDGGSLKKIYTTASEIKFTGTILECNKHRDLVTNQITHTSIGDLELHPLNYENKDILLLDDICDGGRTFIELSKKIRSVWEKNNMKGNKIYLIVTHGIFSAGFYELNDWFDGIYSTNSYSDYISKDENDFTHKLTQINVF